MELLMTINRSVEVIIQVCRHLNTNTSGLFESDINNMYIGWLSDYLLSHDSDKKHVAKCSHNYRKVHVPSCPLK